MKLDFATIKAAVSWPVLLAHYNVKFRESPNVLRGQCPLPTHEQGESKDSFIVTLKTEKAEHGCFSCHSTPCVKARNGKKGGDAITFVSLMQQSALTVAAQSLHDLFCNGNGKPAPPPSRKEPEPAPGRNIPLLEKYPGFACLKGLVSDHEEIRKRGILPATADFFGAGFFSGKGSMSNRYVIPLHNPAGELVAYIGRGEDPKWKIPAGFQVHLELFNIHRVQGKDTVVVVEGAFDAMKLTQWGYDAVALVGTSVSEEQAAMLGLRFDRVVLMLDGDEAGREATDKALVKLASRQLWVKAVHLPDGLDPDMLPKEELHSLLGL